MSADMPVTEAARTLGPEDADGLIGIVRTMARENGDKLDRIVAMLESLPRIEQALTDIKRRVLTIETRLHRIDDTLDQHEARLTALEAARLRHKKPQRKKKC